MASIEKKHLEALLFVAKEPMTLGDIQKRLANDEEKIEDDIVLRWLFELTREYEDRGFRIRQVAGGFEMATAPECHEVIEKIVPKEYESLSKAQLHTLTVVAYNQHINRAGIAKIRGVKNPDEAIQRLLDKNLIADTENGYITTENFLKFFGINDLKELPPLEPVESLNELTEEESGDGNEESQEELLQEKEN